MLKLNEKIERDKRAARLKEARVAANLGGYRKLAQLFRWNENTYKAHEKGQNGFGIEDAKRYAKAFGVALNWLYLGTGEPSDKDADQERNIIDVPFLTWVSAGQLREHESIMSFDDLRTIPAIDLPAGDWIALRVDGNSMNKISPPDSVIFANRDDRVLVPNGCYIVSDETGAATYKRYRPGEKPAFQPASYEEVAPPKFEGAVTVIGRVKRSVIDM